MGFERIGYRGLETGSRHVASHVVKQNQVHKTNVYYSILNFFLQLKYIFDIINQFTEVRNANVVLYIVKKKTIFCFFYLQIIFVFESAYETDNEDMASHISRHGDGVRDVAFNVEDIDIIVKVYWKKKCTYIWR